MNFDLKTLDLRTGAAEKCDQLVVLVGEDFAPGSDPLARLIAQALKSKDFETKPGKSLALYQAPGIAARRLLLVGAGSGDARAVRQALAGQPITCGGATVAEGIAVKAPGALTLPIIRALVDDVVEVGEARLEEAVYRLATMQKLVAEGAGAAALAAILEEPERYRGRKVGMVLSGGNIDSRIMAQVLMRGLVYEGRIVRLRIGITDAPGALARVTRLLGEAGANIVEVHHQRLFHNVPVKMAEVDVVLETRNQTHVDALIARMKDAGYPTSLMVEVG